MEVWKNEICAHCFCHRLIYILSPQTSCLTLQSVPSKPLVTTQESIAFPLLYSLLTKQMTRCNAWVSALLGGLLWPLLSEWADHLELDVSPYLPPISRIPQSFCASWRILCDLGLWAPVNCIPCTLCCAMSIMSLDLVWSSRQKIAALAQSLAVFLLCPSWSWEHFGSCFHEQCTSVLGNECFWTLCCVFTMCTFGTTSTQSWGWHCRKYFEFWTCYGVLSL